MESRKTVLPNIEAVCRKTLQEASNLGNGPLGSVFFCIGTRGRAARSMSLALRLTAATGPGAIPDSTRQKGKTLPRVRTGAFCLFCPPGDNDKMI